MRGRVCVGGLLGKDKHLWGSQRLNNSERDSQHSVQRTSTVRSAHSLQGSGRKDCTERERGRVYKDSTGEEDITVEGVCLRVHAVAHLCA